MADTSPDTTSTLPKFPLPYVFEITTDKKYATKTVVFNSQKKQVQILSKNPIKNWSISVRGTKDDLETLTNFFDNRFGNGYPFTFTDEFGNEQTVRFSSPQLTTKVKRDFNPTSPTNGSVVGFEATITLEEVL